MKTMLFLIFIGFVSQNPDHDILIDKIKDTYSINDEIYFSIFNKSDYDFYYYIGMECLIDGEWREVINDIAAPKSKASKILKINKNEVINFDFQIDTFLNLYKHQCKKYRLKINYGKKVEKIDKFLFSKPFLISK